MVVIMLISILAMIAAPSMSVARNDRVAFDYARQTSELFHNARARAAGRGAAHLVVYTTDASYGGDRGAVYVFEGLDGVAAPTGPNPSTSCRSPAQWADVIAYVPGAARSTLRMRLIDFLDVNRSEANSTQVIEDMRMLAHLTDMTAAPTAGSHVPGAAIGSVAVCTTPNGSTFVGTGGTPGAAISAMVDATDTFKGTFEIDVMRRRGGTPVGLIRRVILSGAAAPRIKSE
jgi:Tfp pilus assembly protein FimT